MFGNFLLQKFFSKVECRLLDVVVLLNVCRPSSVVIVVSGIIVR